MKLYGATKNSMYSGCYERRSEHERGNRGRNRTLAESHNRKKALAPRDFESRVNRALRKRERRVAKEQIREELHLVWLERELLDMVPRRKPFKPGDYAYLRQVATEVEIETLHEDACRYRRDMDDLLYQEDNWYPKDDYLDWDYDYDDTDDNWYYNDYAPEPDPQEPEWRDAWVEGRVSTEYQVDEITLDEANNWDDYLESEDSPYADDYDPQEWWTEYCASRLLPAPRVRLDADRNRERLRAGERFYRQRKRTVAK